MDITKHLYKILSIIFIVSIIFKMYYLIPIIWIFMLLHLMYDIASSVIIDGEK